MKVNIVSRKFIKPCNPTPRDLKSYKISMVDEINPPMNVAAILFYSDQGYPILLEESLGKILPKFYPLAGRYMKQNQTVDCTDEGAEFVEAQADCGMLQVMKEANDCGSLLYDFLPCEIGEVDEITDPLLSIQVTKFSCGGLAIGVCVSHRVFDACSLGTFIAAWAANAATLNPAAGEKVVENVISPSFEAITLFPGRNHGTLDNATEMWRTRDPTFVTKRILFDKVAIQSLKDIAKQNSITRALSRVLVVCAFLAEVLIEIDRTEEDEGRSRDYLITQAVNMRGRTIPPISKHSCGNLVAQAFIKCLDHASNETKNMDFKDYVNLLGEATEKTILDCAEIFSKDDELCGYNVVVDPVMKVVERIIGGDVKVLWFTDWSKFGFYETDFGWGKPVWASSVGPYMGNLVILMDNKGGDGIEACIHLHQKYESRFEEHQEIKLFKTIHGHGIDLQDSGVLK